MLAPAWCASVQPDAVLPSAIMKIADLRFGDIFTVNTANSITLDPDGTRAATEPGTLGAGTGAGPAAFLLTGAPGAAFHLFLPSKLTLSSTADSMQVMKFSSTLKANHGTLGPDGRQTIAIGATLQVNAGQTPGQYAGMFEVSVNFE